MEKTRPRIQGKKTREQQRRTLERKPDLPRKNADGDMAQDQATTPRRLRQKGRQSEMPVSRRGMNQESQHHKPDRA